MGGDEKAQRSRKEEPVAVPRDFMFQLSAEELENWRSQIATSNSAAKMGLRRPPYAFTELGVAMLSSVLKSERAVPMNIIIMRAFVKLREILATNKAMAERIEQITRTVKDHAALFELVIGDIQALDHKFSRELGRLKAPRRAKSRIGFHIPETR